MILADSLTQSYDHFLIMGKNGSADNGKAQFVQFGDTTARAASWWGFFFRNGKESILAQRVYMWGIASYELHENQSNQKVMCKKNVCIYIYIYIYIYTPFKYR